MPKACAFACKHKVHDGAAFSIFAFGKDMKMERFRIGYDVTILWSVTDKKGVALPLTDKEVHLYYTCERGRFEADIEIQDDNVVVWHFLNEEQRVLGSYGLTLEVLQSNGKRAIRKDICEAFTLVGKSCFEETEGEANVLEGGEIVLASEIDIYRISPVIPQIGKNGNWWVDGQDTGRPASSTFILDFTVKDIRDAIRDTRGVIEKQTDKKAIVNALKSHSLIVIPLGSYSEGYCLVQGEEDGADTLTITFNYSQYKYSILIGDESIEVDRSSSISALEARLAALEAKLS